jgi:hypothetical protein
VKQPETTPLPETRPLPVRRTTKKMSSREPSLALACFLSILIRLLIDFSFCLHLRLWGQYGLLVSLDSLSIGRLDLFVS